MKKVFCYVYENNNFENRTQEDFFFFFVFIKGSSFEKDGKSLWEYFHKRLKDEKQNVIKESFSIDKQGKNQFVLIYGYGEEANKLKESLLLQKKEKEELDNIVNNLKNYIRDYDKWGDPKYKNLLIHLLKHYPTISDNQKKVLYISNSKLQKYLNNKNDVSTTNEDSESLAKNQNNMDNRNIDIDELEVSLKYGEDLLNQLLSTFKNDIINYSKNNCLKYIKLAKTFNEWPWNRKRIIIDNEIKSNFQPKLSTIKTFNIIKLYPYWYDSLGGYIMLVSINNVNHIIDINYEHINKKENGLIFESPNINSNNFTIDFIKTIIDDIDQEIITDSFYDIRKNNEDEQGEKIESKILGKYEFLHSLSSPSIQEYINNYNSNPGFDKNIDDSQFLELQKVPDENIEDSHVKKSYYFCFKIIIGKISFIEYDGHNYLYMSINSPVLKNKINIAYNIDDILLEDFNNQETILKLIKLEHLKNVNGKYIAHESIHMMYMGDSDENNTLKINSRNEFIDNLIEVLENLNSMDSKNPHNIGELYKGESPYEYNENKIKIRENNLKDILLNYKNGNIEKEEAISKIMALNNKKYSNKNTIELLLKEIDSIGSKDQNKYNVLEMKPEYFELFLGKEFDSWDEGDEPAYDHFRDDWEDTSDDCEDPRDEYEHKIYNIYKDDEKRDRAFEHLKALHYEEAHNKNIKDKNLNITGSCFTYGAVYSGILFYDTYKGKNYIVGGVYDYGQEEGGYCEVYEAGKITKEFFEKNFKEIIKVYLTMDHTDVY